MRLSAREAPSGLDKVLLPGEKLVLAVHQHWATLIEPVASTLAALALAIWVDSNVTKASEALGTICWWIFLAVLVRLIWVSLDYNNHWFIATDKRLLLRYGIVTRQIGMMPLLKVTDMRYVRSPLGRILRYGRFVLESAGQDQALREIKWVPKPDDTYQKICEQIFHLTAPVGVSRSKDLDDELPDVEFTDEEFTDEEFTGRGGPTANSGPFLGGAPGFPDVHGTHDPIQERLDSYSRAVPVQRGPVLQRPRHEVVYESEDIRRRRRSADTGPIWPQGDPASDD